MSDARQIEFRGKSMTNYWLYGSLVYSENIQPAIYIETGKKEKHFDWAYVIPETVGQYTGLLDKNGTKIFEGDILRVNTGRSKPYYEIRTVGWEIAYFFGFVFDQGKYKPEYHEVIGNIHDNPELLAEVT